VEGCSYSLTEQPFVWVGDQPPEEAESLALWIVLDNWRGNGYQAGVDNIRLQKGHIFTLQKCKRVTS
jgi:hypothetical protein